MDQILYILHCHEVTKGIFYNERGATIEFSDKLSTLSFFGVEEMWPNIFATDLTEISGRKGLRRRGELKNRDDNFTDGLTLRQTSVESSSVPCKTTHRFERNQIRARTQNRQFATVFGGNNVTTKSSETFFKLVHISADIDTVWGILFHGGETSRSNDETVS